MGESQSLQERYAPSNACWGCGPANRTACASAALPRAMRWWPNGCREQKYEAFPGVLNGGIIGTLLDCHCNWTAAWHLMHKAQAGFSAVHRHRRLRDQTLCARRRRAGRFFSRPKSSSRPGTAPRWKAHSPPVEKFAQPAAALSSRSRKAIRPFIAGRTTGCQIARAVPDRDYTITS